MLLCEYKIHPAAGLSQAGEWIGVPWAQKSPQHPQKHCETYLQWTPMGAIYILKVVELKKLSHKSAKCCRTKIGVP